MRILSLDKLSLHTRISLVLTALAAVLVGALGGLWLKQTHDAIREEVTAATRVAEQWLIVAAGELRREPSSANADRLLAQLKAVGRIRANALEVLDADGQRRYLSPQSTYKTGRFAPAWFSAVVQLEFATRYIAAGDLTLVLHPDASRAAIDAWDDVCTLAG